MAMLTAAQHKDLLADMLTAVAGGQRNRWRLLIGTIEVRSILTNPFCNWSIRPGGTVEELLAIKRAARLVRASHPRVRR